MPHYRGLDDLVEAGSGLAQHLAHVLQGLLGLGRGAARHHAAVGGVPAEVAGHVEGVAHPHRAAQREARGPGDHGAIDSLGSGYLTCL